MTLLAKIVKILFEWWKEALETARTASIKGIKQLCVRLFRYVKLCSLCQRVATCVPAKQDMKTTCV